ncbi:hypothetical protein [Sphingomonas oryzagri]|uniref:Surface antigen domain-containing protein n=1 Tax=Sphingomonas oryzagri TaxID=3042314 RepID=A0ABT6MZW4_9SPHN|nr:hypothetical protein [Sphingomonas oryzagri]MDH7638596.1 hypothetical protein [Sphingomonas oryzagri]
MTTALLTLAACSDRSKTPDNGQGPAVAVAANGAASGGSNAAAVPAGNDGGINPLGSQAVKDAIHRALKTGQTQRWSDAGLAGYAVPSPTADARGCRTVRYTIDQQPERTFPIITACDAG